MEARRMASDGTKRLAGLALFTALVVVLQLVGTFVKIGAFPLSLVMIPIVIGGAVYGVKAGAYLGFAFGVVVTLSCVFGWDAAGYLLWASKPLATLLIVLLKGTLAGLAAALVYRLFRRRAYLGTVLAALICPVVNTGIFCAGMLLLFRETLTERAGGTDLVTYILVVIVGINFVIETALDMLLCPAVRRIIQSGKRV